MPPLHPLIVHFPIALFCIGVLFDCVTAFRLRGIPNSDRHSVKAEIGIFNPATRLIMVLGFLGALVAVVSGEWLKVQKEAFLPHGLLALHQLLAFIFTGWYAVMLFFRLRRHWRPSKGYLAIAITGVLLLTAVGHTGGSMAWPATHAVVPGAPTASSQVGQNTSSSQMKTTNQGTKPIANSQKEKKTAATTSDFLLKQGDHGQKVSQLQQQLNQIGYFNHAITGYYGSTTSASVSSFQTANGLSATGNLDQKTLNVILEKLKQKKPSTTAASSKQSTTSKRTVSTTTQTNTSTIDQAKYDNGYRLFVSSCQSCHSLSTATQYEGKLSDSQWRQVVAQMQSYAGGSIPNTEDIIYYLDHHK